MSSGDRAESEVVHLDLVPYDRPLLKLVCWRSGDAPRRADDALRAPRVDDGELFHFWTMERYCAVCVNRVETREQW